MSVGVLRGSPFEKNRLLLKFEKKRRLFGDFFFAVRGVLNINVLSVRVRTTPRNIVHIYIDIEVTWRNEHQHCAESDSSLSKIFRETNFFKVFFSGFLYFPSFLPSKSRLDVLFKKKIENIISEKNEFQKTTR